MEFVVDIQSQNIANSPETNLSLSMPGGHFQNYIAEYQYASTNPHNDILLKFGVDILSLTKVIGQ